MRALSSLVGVGLLLVFAGCGGSSGGGSGSATVLTGQFVDSVVQGLAYSSGDLSGLTDAEGRFQYSGTVTFSLGGTTLGSTPGAPRLTPVNLVPNVFDENDATVTNIARLLLTLDDDGNPDNGIAIPAATRTAFESFDLNFAQQTGPFGQDPDVLAALAAASAGPLVGQPAAQQHLRNSLFALAAGRYRGTFSGDDSGNFEFLLNRAGKLIGWGISAGEGFFFFLGNVPSSGFGSFGGTTSNSATFTGEIRAGMVRGAWGDGVEFGEFAGSQIQTVSPSLSPDVLQQIAGTYTGTGTQGGASGPVVITVQPDGQMTIADPLGGFAEGALVETTSEGATMIALAEDATEVMGTFDLAGNVSGTLVNTVEGDSGTFQASR